MMKLSGDVTERHCCDCDFSRCLYLKSEAHIPEKFEHQESRIHICLFLDLERHAFSRVKLELVDRAC
jgi:hypothetical protein